MVAQKRCRFQALVSLSLVADIVVDLLADLGIEVGEAMNVYTVEEARRKILGANLRRVLFPILRARGVRL